jgi:hypothetical protein
MKTLEQVVLSLLLIMVAPQALRAQLLCTTNADNSITITGYIGTVGALQIPGTVDGFPVTSIGNGAFWGRFELTDVTMPDGITYIGVGAFSHCGMTSITIPSSVIEMGPNAFGGCGSLTNVVLPDSLTKIPEFAFGEGFHLSTILIPTSVTSIEGNAFDDCDHLDGIFFCGNAPGIGGPYVFAWNPSDPLHYLAGKSGWTDMLGRVEGASSDA